MLIHGRKRLDIDFRRTIRFEDLGIHVGDEIRGDGGSLVETLHRGAVFTTIHMGSSQYFIPNELEESAGEDDRIEPGAIAAGVTLDRKIVILQESA